MSQPSPEAAKRGAWSGWGCFLLCHQPHSGFGHSRPLPHPLALLAPIFYNSSETREDLLVTVTLCYCTFFFPSGKYSGKHCGSNEGRNNPQSLFLESHGVRARVLRGVWGRKVAVMAIPGYKTLVMSIHVTSVIYKITGLKAPPRFYTRRPSRGCRAGQWQAGTKRKPKVCLYHLCLSLRLNHLPAQVERTRFTWPGPQHSRHHHACFVDGLMVHPQGPETCERESSSQGLDAAEPTRCGANLVCVLRFMAQTLT